MLPFEFVIDGPPMSAQSHNRERLAAWKVEVAAAAAERWTGPTFQGKARVVVTYYHDRESAGLDADNRQATHVTARVIRLVDGRILDLKALVARELLRGREFLHVLIEEDR